MPARLGKPTRLRQPVKHSTGHTYLCFIANTMQAAKKCRVPNLLSLPEELLVDIVSRLDDLAAYNVELANKKLCDAMSRYDSTWPRKQRLDLRASSKMMPLSPDKCRYPLSLQALNGTVLPGRVA